MPYVVVEDFRLGLDRRRSQVAGAPGTLWDCFNCHITRGGEVEKRKAFVPTFALPAAQTFGMQQASNQIYVFGSVTAPGVPAGVNYVQCIHPDGIQAATACLYSEVFNGSPYSIMQFADGSIHHYANGVRVEDWDNGIVRPDMANNNGIAAHLAAIINESSNYIASPVGNVITIRAANSSAQYTASASTINKPGGVNDQQIVLTQTQPNVAAVPEVLATASFTVTGGTHSAGVNKVTSITVNGIDCLGAAVDWVTSNGATAQALATQINSFTSNPDYTATVSNATVTITAAPGSGASPNTYPVTVNVAGNVTVGSTTNMANGVPAVAPIAAIYTATINGTFEPGDMFNIQLSSLNGLTVLNFGYQGNPSPIGTTLLTSQSKLYSTGGSVTFFSALNDDTLWNTPEDLGAGFQDMATQDGGSDTLTGLASFLGNMVVFSRKTTQIWFMDPNPANNRWMQTLRNIGSRSPKSMQPLGNNDLFFLDAPGVRSLRAFFATSLAMLTDIGTPIDTLIQAAVASLSDLVVTQAAAVIEPRDKRYWLALGNSIYVFSYFQTAKIDAWSRYDVGFQITDFAIINDRVYARAGDTIYLYGGPNNTSYDTGPSDAYTATATLPYLTAGKPATRKTLIGFGAATTGTWTVNMLTDPNNPAISLDYGVISGVTYTSKMNAGQVETTHFAPQLICTTPGPASIANLAVEYETSTAPDPLDKGE